ncbi:stearoyl-CoA 9-desaturase [Coemansia aciculifera]|uniref:Acyl-CoA desaturase n=2 Tax=Coemansia TaxID=4863 RepID=A0A9W8GXS1_9FUNG|nr:stearoyl-CoA 9-desaturase [Coemansia pectinata]KAJ2866065.1 stearoyl-CoA 9-desaturase [Coemansia aciculifera]KAJ2875653.1 stearoyl-CoA 9-desaturase [Coemansia aciculifera]
MSGMYIERPTYKREKSAPETRPLLERLHWVHVILLSTTPLIALYGVLTTTLSVKTMLWATLYYAFAGLGITAGYHRMWAHTAYSATYPLQLFLAFAGSAAVQGSIFWWARDHRVHHRYTDTPRDPYDAIQGFWHCHIGWMLVKKDRRRLGYADTSDLKSDPLVRWQHKYYPLLVLVFGVVLPTSVAGLLWGDWRGGFFYATVLRMVMLHHATFCVNSLAHTIGTHTYDDVQTARDSWITALVTMGEGYHNFHHQFPNDYRNAIRFYQYDPTKWFIRAMASLGLAYDLKTFPANEIEKGFIQMRMQELENKRVKLTFGTPVAKLPVFTEQEFLDQVKTNKKQWMVIEGYVYDVKPFINDHPGGKALIMGGIGKDMTEAFNGGVYQHHNSARNLMNTSLRIGVLQRL